MEDPCAPISYSDAKPILAARRSHRSNPARARIAGPDIPHWPRPGQGPMKTDFDWTTKPYDIVATIPGDEFPDEWVIAAITTTFV